jgi:thiol-disulfide isomerase/thioredoxin
MTNLQAPIIYLETADIENGQIIGCDFETAVVFIFATYCGHCTAAKPALSEFAQNNPDIPVFVIWTDSKEPADSNIMSKIKPHLNVPGYPHYAIVKKGVIKDKPIQGRTSRDLENFARS